MRIRSDSNHQNDGCLQKWKKRKRWQNTTNRTMSTEKKPQNDRENLKNCQLYSVQKPIYTVGRLVTWTKKLGPDSILRCSLARSHVCRSTKYAHVTPCYFD
jgi:hypothetical protein